MKTSNEKTDDELYQEICLILGDYFIKNILFNSGIQGAIEQLKEISKRREHGKR